MPFILMQVARRVEIEKPGTACLKFQRRGSSILSRIGTDSGKVAPGMDAVFTVRFQPASVDDYKWDLVVRTERERFLIPVSGTGQQLATSAACTRNICRDLLLNNFDRRARNVMLSKMPANSSCALYKYTYVMGSGHEMSPGPCPVGRQGKEGLVKMMH